MFVSVAEELEREAPRRTLTVGEDVGWIRRTLLARSRFEEARWRAVFARQRRLGSRADVPVGIRQPARLSSAQPRSGLPQLATTPVTTTQTGLPQASIRAARPQVAGQLSTIKPTQRVGAMDLSGILGQVADVARTYYQIRGLRDPRPIMAQPVNLAGPLIRGGIQLGRQYLPQIAGGIVGGAIGGELTSPMPNQFVPPDFPIAEAEMSMDCTKPSDIYYGWDEKLMTYVPKKKRKRRRRQLVTKGDIKGLAALKGVVGTGKIMETWIATHC